MEAIRGKIIYNRDERNSPITEMLSDLLDLVFRPVSGVDLCVNNMT